MAAFKRSGGVPTSRTHLNSWGTAMTPAQAETIAATDNATVAILHALIAFLEKQGVMSREDFAAFLQAAIEGWRAEGADEKLMQMIEIKAKGMALGPPPSMKN
ncbi:hypothetical protein [Methylobacterium oxalidis]|nr:hypothetical protein [Methylobacterium oxalidis]GJE31171.1 hypothetical protein LDDCCGHA_1347 [Methylobacterium oxalidis]